VPNYFQLVKFLIDPLLDRQEALSIDCEVNGKGDRVWVRVAFDPIDKGRVYGRGGRTIQAIRTLVQTAAQVAGQNAYFEVFDPEGNNKPNNRDGNRDNNRRPSRGPSRRR
jgi:predicted RNA-binding protein YlqC (UPF0109 family)